MDKTVDTQKIRIKGRLTLGRVSLTFPYDKVITSETNVITALEQMIELILFLSQEFRNGFQIETQNPEVVFLELAKADELGNTRSINVCPKPLTIEDEGISDFLDVMCEILLEVELDLLHNRAPSIPEQFSQAQSDKEYSLRQGQAIALLCSERTHLYRQLQKLKDQNAHKVRFHDESNESHKDQHEIDQQAERFFNWICSQRLATIYDKSQFFKIFKRITSKGGK